MRDFNPADFAAFYDTANDPEYQKFYPRRETTEEFWRQIFDRILTGTAVPERKVYQLAICLPDGELIGTCGVRSEAPEQQQASFGCAIARPYWGQGFAYEASRRIIDFAFSSLPVQRIYAETISENVKARALAERLGMQFEGELKENRFFRGRWWNTVIYAVLQDDWAQNENG